MIELTAHPRGTVLRVRARPGARVDAILGEHAGALRIAVTAAPERGKANAAIARSLAEAIGCRPSEIEILSGEGSREKRFLIAGLDPEALRSLLKAVLPPAD